jgi:hypothetical protein
LELTLEVIDLGLELVDFKEGLRKGVSEIGGQVFVLESVVGLGEKGAGA